MLDGSGQRLNARMFGHADVREAVHLVPEWLPLGDDVRNALPAIWTRLLGHPGFNADVIEDLSRPVGDRLMGLGMAIALNTEWEQLIERNPPAYAAAALYRDLLHGRFAPPDDRELGRRNASGKVSFLVLHYHQRLSDMENPDTLEMLGAAMELFRRAHSGYRLQGLYQEGIGDQGFYLTSMGFRQLTSREPSGKVPELYGLDRAHARRLMPGMPVRDAFQFTPPQFGFTLSERKLLRLAVQQMTDTQIGDELGLSAHTVKKLWRTIFLRVLDVMPGLFDDQTDGGDMGTRGPEKRRSLLGYLYQHLEELRPYCSVTAQRLLTGKVGVHRAKALSQAALTP